MPGTQSESSGCRRSLIPQEQIDQFESRVVCIRNDLSEAKNRRLNQLFLDRMDRARSWLDRAVDAVRAQDYEQTFIALWVALNALYGVPESEMPEIRNGESRELKRIAGFVGLLWNSDQETLLDSARATNRKVRMRGFLRNPFLIEPYWREGPSGLKKFLSGPMSENRVLQSLQDNQADKFLEGLLTRIYVLRNQVFHGCSTNSRGTNRGSLLPSIKILMVIVPRFWSIMMRDRDHKKWGKLPYPRAWSPGHPRPL